MTPQDDETIWRNRFIAMNMMRIGATLVVLLGLLIWQSNVVVEGGSILGLPITLVALTVSFVGPKWMARRWKTPPSQ